MTLIDIDWLSALTPIGPVQQCTTNDANLT